MCRSVGIFDDRDVRFTRKGDTVYAFLLGWPGDGARVTIKSLASGHGPADIHAITLLGTAGPVPFERTSDGLTVHMSDACPSKHAVVLRIE